MAVVQTDKTLQCTNIHDHNHKDYIYICNMQNILMLIQTKDVYTYIYMYVCIKFTCINEHV